jgi:probable blue pigment (indigoidine) exporter
MRSIRSLSVFFLSLSAINFTFFFETQIYDFNGSFLSSTIISVTSRIIEKERGIFVGNLDNMKNFFIGLAFALLWSSASVTSKFALAGGQPPLWLMNLRYLMAAAVLMPIVHGIQRNALPKSTEWKSLFIYGALNNAGYISLFIYGLKGTSAGISTLALAINPLLISLSSSFFLDKKISKKIWLGLGLGTMGIICATYPLLRDAFVSLEGILFLGASMLCYSIGTVYYTTQNWTLPKLTINAWQVFFGAIVMLPITFLCNDIRQTQYTPQFWASILWLVFMVTIVAVQLWLNLLSIDPIRASFWIFACPIIGFFYAYWLLNEPITSYTLFGTLLVIGGLYVGKEEK